MQKSIIAITFTEILRYPSKYSLKGVMKNQSQNLGKQFHVYDASRIQKTHSNSY